MAGRRRRRPAPLRARTNPTRSRSPLARPRSLRVASQVGDRHAAHDELRARKRSPDPAWMRALRSRSLSAARARRAGRRSQPRTRSRGMAAGDMQLALPTRSRARASGSAPASEDSLEAEEDDRVPVYVGEEDRVDRAPTLRPTLGSAAADRRRSADCRAGRGPARPPGIRGLSSRSVRRRRARRCPTPRGHAGAVQPDGVQACQPHDSRSSSPRSQSPGAAPARRGLEPDGGGGAGDARTARSRPGGPHENASRSSRQENQQRPTRARNAGGPGSGQARPGPCRSPRGRDQPGTASRRSPSRRA
jgi:hypothetical protein